MPKATIKVYERYQLRNVVLHEIATNGTTCDLNHLDVRKVLDMSGTFEGTNFVGDVSAWNVSNAWDLRGMFENCPFQGDLSKWALGFRMQMKGMLASTFRGVLPVLPGKSSSQRTAIYTAMFDGADKYNDYLTQKPFGRLHAAFLVASHNPPNWLTLDEAIRLKSACDVGLGFGLQDEALYAFIEEQYRSLGQAEELEIPSMDFNA